MTDTRKQIIELIEPYMDKTLSFGCWCFNKVTKNYFKSETANGGNKVIKERTDIVKILGHYDITSVLKYIESKGFGGVINKNTIHIVQYTSDWEFDILTDIPNKPLHLFTDQEDKDLLTLLQKIGN